MVLALGLVKVIEKGSDDMHFERKILRRFGRSQRLEVMKDKV
jgi:hypothetical protein